MRLKITLVSYTKDPEITCAKCASVSWRRKGMKEISLEEARKIIKDVLECGHESVIEHASFTFFAEGISRSLTHQLVRHRIASFTQQSMRYVDLSRAEKYFIRPKSLTENEEMIAMFDDVMFKCKKVYDALRKKGVPPEDARFVLPIASQTKIAITMNARELRHFFALRCCLRAQWEIRQLARRMLGICRTMAPSLFKNSGPSCVVLGYCPEGKLTCGKLNQILKIYKSHSF
jgi:thymidylate synthase (FAD)